MADQDQKIEKKPEEGGSKDFESVPEFGAEKTNENIEEKNNLENISSPENDQEKKREVIESIQQKSGSGNDDDDEEGDKKNIKIHAKDISEIKDIEQRVDKLVQLAIQKDPYTAVKVARHLDENYILDQVHDRLVEDETKKALISKGLLKEF
ncbi:MAG: hypothetical protein PF549_03475 [Patescibacteria group bacterium]|jgi:hypothetical protein|nr:hypothetical protein [Patescibacteria group bacterium]